MKALDLRYVASRECLLKCPSCYLKEELYMKGNAALKAFPGNFEEYTDLNITHYLNVEQTVDETDKQFSEDLFHFTWLLGSGSPLRTLASYTLITDVQTFRKKLSGNSEKLLREFINISGGGKWNLSRIGKGFTKSLFLSMKSASDYEERRILDATRLAGEWGFDHISFAWVHGLDRQEMWPTVDKLLRAGKMKITLMFKKPVLFHPSMISALREVSKEYGPAITMDICILKTVDGHDCTKQQGSKKYMDIVTKVGDEGWFPCTYTSRRCLVEMSLDENRPGLLTGDRFLEEMFG